MQREAPDSLARLLEQARQGDRAAFSEIVLKLMNQVTALTYRMTGDREAAKDLAQETFVSAWRNIAGYRGEASVHNWIYRIATNKTLNYLKSVQVRSNSAERLMNEAPEISNDNPHRDLEQNELSQEFRRFVSQLPPQQRAIFELRFYQQLSFDEIAHHLERGVSSVKTGYREAIKKLRSYAQAKGLQS